jgi:hypothetical protein
MSRLRPWFLLIAVLSFGTYPMYASQYVVGTCRTGVTTYSTISAAVAAAPAGSTVMVCPGTYAEQVTISEPLTLEGIGNANSGQVIIAASGGLTTNGATLGGNLLAAQILVTAAPVNISQITVDGIGNGLDNSVVLAGIYYGSGASGVISDVTTRNQINGGNGVGIFAENGNTTTESVVIEHSSVHDYDFAGIWVNANVNAKVQANSVSSANANAYTYGILAGYPVSTTVASVTGNYLIGPGANNDAQGLTVMSPSATVSGNTFTGWYFAAVDFGAGTYSSNSTQNSTIGFYLGVPSSTIESSTITQSFAAIDFNCSSGNVSHNVINDASIAMYESLVSTDAGNDFFNVATIQGASCTAATARRLPKEALTPRVVPLASGKK